jgi:hypothetical protein
MFIKYFYKSTLFNELTSVTTTYRLLCCQDVSASEHYSIVVTLHTTKFNIQTLLLQSSDGIYLFCKVLKTNSDYFPLQHHVTGFCNRKCVYCAVRTECLNTIVNLRLNDTML